jgi:hypothetical protein
MLDTYIKNRGSTKTIIHDNNQNNINQINWDADYDGQNANISLDLTNNGKSDHYDIKLNNNDLAKMLNFDSVNLPLDKRLKGDFGRKKNMNVDPATYYLYLEDLQSSPLLPIPTTMNPKLMNYNPTVSLDSDKSLENLLQLSSPDSHISSPLPGEELLIPLTIDDNSMQSYVLTPGKRHRRPRTHKTHRVYKHPRVTTSTSKKYKSKSKPKTRRKRRTSPRKNSLQQYFNI